MNRRTLRYVLILLLTACNSTPSPAATVLPSPTPSPSPTAIPPPTATPPPSTPGYDALALEVVPPSQVKFDVEFAGVEVGGKLDTSSGTITLLESDAGTHLLVDLIIDMETMDTGIGPLNDILKDMFNVDQYPTAHFQAELFDALPGRYPRGEEVVLPLPSKLTLQTDTVDTLVDTVATLDGRHMEVTATFAIGFDDIAAEAPPMVGNDITFEVTLVTE